MKRSKMIMRDIVYCLEWVREEKDKIDVRTESIKYKKFLLLEKDLEDIEKYINSGEWLVRQEAQDKIKYIIKTNYNYGLVAQKYNTTEDAIRTFITYCNQKLKEKIGENTIDLLLEGKRGVAKAQFETLRGLYALNNLYPQNVLDMLPKSREAGYTLEECKKELEFLYVYSQEHLLELYEQCDMQKLANILHYMESTSPDISYERYGLVRLLTGNGKGVDEMFTKIEQIKK